MATATLTPGDVVRLKSKEDFANGVVLRVSELQEVGGKKHKCILTDGNATMRGVLASQFADLVATGELSDGCLIKITAFVINTVGSDEMLLATDLSVVKAGASQPMDMDNALSAHNSTPETAGKPQVKSGASGAVAKENSTPMPTPPTDFKTSKNKTPGPPGGGMSPVSFFSSASAPTPPGAGIKSAPTPPSTMGVSGRKRYHMIEQLNPYDTNWCIKAKLERKPPLRALPSKPDVKILAVDLVDEMGWQIQGTFWRAPAERFSEQLVEGKVYVFNKFKVKPADKKYASFKADYQIDFMDSTEITEAADQDTSTMTAAVVITPIEQLPRRVGTRASVDVMGVILTLGSLGTIKRKADNSELPRRDVTLGDSSGKSVVVTLWGDSAHATVAQLEGQEGRAVLQVTQARVTDFNGCSISSLTKTVVTVNPEVPAAQQMLMWYKTAEMTPDRFTPVGQDLPGTRGASGGGAGSVPSRERFQTLKDVEAVTPDTLEGDKAVFQSVSACIAMVSSDMQMYYLANPENGRKVVDQGGGRFWSEADGKVVERPEHRYVLNVKVQDHTGEASVQLFNKEAEAVMGMKADELAVLKDAGGEGFAAAMRAAQWRPWQVVVMSKAREYNGNRSVRHTAHKVDPIDWVAEAGRLVTLIGKYSA